MARPSQKSSNASSIVYCFGGFPSPASSASFVLVKNH
jgi:hypothetical protein